MTQSMETIRALIEEDSYCTSRELAEMHGLKKDSLRILQGGPQI